MDQGLFEKIVAECGEFGCSMLHLHNFGEPLLDELIPDRIRLAKKKGIRQVKIFSNGALLKGQMAERLLESGLDEIKISVDGADVQEFNKLRKGLIGEEVIENTRNFRRLRDQRGSRRPRIVATCTQTSNRKETWNMLNGAVDRILYADLHNWAGELKLGHKLKVRQPCFRLWRTFTVLANGDVTLCCMDYSGREIVGNCRADNIVHI